MASTNDIELLVNAIKNAIEQRMINVHTAIPAKVVSFNASENTISAQPLLKKRFRDGTSEFLPQIQNVPVCFPQGGGGILTFPLRADDPVLLVFSERSIDVWWEKGGIVDPLDNRKHNLSDAFAIPGIQPKATANSRVSADHVRLENSNASIQLEATGKFLIKNLQGEELFDLLIQLLDALTQTKVPTSIGPQPFINLATYTTLKSKFEGLKGG